MKITRTTHRFLFLVMMSAAAPNAFCSGAEITRLDAVADADSVRIAIDVTAPVRPTIHVADRPCRLIIDFLEVALLKRVREIVVDEAGVSNIQATMRPSTPVRTRIVVGIDSVRPFGIENSGNRLVVSILPHPGRPKATSMATAATNAMHRLAASSTSLPPEEEHTTATSELDETPFEAPTTARQRFRIKFIAGNTAYINGGLKSGLRIGMNLDVHGRDADVDAAKDNEGPIGAARIIGVATTSAILEVGTASADLQVEDWAELLPYDADVARRNVLTGPDNTVSAAPRSIESNLDSSREPRHQSFRNTRAAEADPRTRAAGRIGLDCSGISSIGSTPGGSTQLGMSIQSDIKHIAGTHWNLDGYWRGRINRHSQFRQPTIEDSLNKTYTMQLYYDNPDSGWVVGLGRLYLPWAVSLDTVDGGYFGRKLPFGNTTGAFAGSTPDLNSWHYRPNQRIAGLFTNFERGDYERFHYSSTSGIALTSLKWKLDRPFAFFENEFSYKGKLSAYHSLIADAPRGTSTNGMRVAAGVSHSYFTLHYQPESVISFDVYHNFFRDVPTAATSIVGTGVLDKLLFQGISGGTHFRPIRKLTLYTTLGTSERTGDAHRSLNEMFGATLNQIGRTGLRADFHYSKFDSNFGKVTTACYRFRAR